MSDHGGVAELAPALSKAIKSKTNGGSKATASDIDGGSKAKQLQTKMVLTWMFSDRMPIDGVFDLLELSDLETRGLTHESVEALELYIKEGTRN